MPQSTQSIPSKAHPAYLVLHDMEECVRNAGFFDHCSWFFVWRS